MKNKKLTKRKVAKSVEVDYYQAVVNRAVQAIKEVPYEQRGAAFTIILHQILDNLA
jgi:hypothetical protein